MAVERGRSTGRRDQHGRRPGTPTRASSASSSCSTRPRRCSPTGATRATRIADICAAAGVAKGLFYWYFPTKESAVRRAGAHDAPAAAPGAGRGDGPRRRPGRPASARAPRPACVFMAEHRSYFALLDVERADDEVAGVLREGSDVYADDVVRLVARGAGGWAWCPTATPRAVRHRRARRGVVVQPRPARRAARHRRRRAGRLRRRLGGAGAGQRTLDSRRAARSTDGDGVGVDGASSCTSGWRAPEDATNASTIRGSNWVPRAPTMYCDRVERRPRVLVGAVRWSSASNTSATVTTRPLSGMSVPTRPAG